MRTLNHPPRRLTNGYPIIDLNHRRHFTITLISLIAGILILIVPLLLNFIVAIYLIIT